MQRLRVLSWNVNGIRACVRKGFMGWLDGADADIVGLQEVRATEDQLPAELRASGWHQAYAPAVKKGYSGVAILSRQPPDAVHTALAPQFDVEGRLIIARFGKLAVCSVYFPKGSGPNRDNSRIPYKLDFYRALYDHLQTWRKRGYRVLCMGDMNTAHQDIDLARPKQNVENSGFRPEEREELERWLRRGRWVDTFRKLHPDGGHYTWWSQRFGLRERNVGWRLDYVLASPSAMKHVRRAFIQPEVHGSDHCPVGVDLDRAVLAR